MRFGPIVQLGYLVPDIERAARHWTETLGVGPFFLIEHTPFTELWYRGRAISADQSAALAQWGDLQIELIEPVSGAVEPYLPYLPADRSDATPRFHHISLRRDNYDEMQAEIARLGLPFVCEGGIPDLLYTYLDGRSTFGHYVEYVWASDAGWKMIGWPEGRPTI